MMITAGIRWLAKFMQALLAVNLSSQYIGFIQDFNKGVYTQEKRVSFTA